MIETLERERPFTRPIVTGILPATTFYEKEEYHQEYYKKNAFLYQHIDKSQGEMLLLRRTGARAK